MPFQLEEPRHSFYHPSPPPISREPFHSGCYCLRHGARHTLGDLIPIMGISSHKKHPRCFLSPSHICSLLTLASKGTYTHHEKKRSPNNDKHECQQHIAKYLFRGFSRNPVNILCNKYEMKLVAKNETDAERVEELPCLVKAQNMNVHGIIPRFT